MTDPDVPDDRQIDELEETIDDARRRAEDHGTIPDSDPDPSWVDPDGDGERETPKDPPV